MRRMTLLWLLLAAIAGGVLFHTSQQVTDGRTRLNVLADDLRKEDETIRVLQAEWSYLNQPDRLEKLSKQYLDLAPLKGRQFTKLEEVPDRPAAGMKEDAASAAADDTPAAAAAAAPATATVAAERPAPEKPVAERQPPEKPVPVRTAAVKKPAPVVKIRKPAAPPPAAKNAAPETASESAAPRSFSDMIKNLGVR